LDGERILELDEMPPFVHLDMRVMMLVGENRPWVSKALERCVAVSDEIVSGILPCDRAGCYFDEVLMGASLIDAPAMLSELTEFFETSPACPGADQDDEEDAGWLADDDWGLVSDKFDDDCRWDDWEVLVMNDHPLLRIILDTRHPFTWFDPEAVGETIWQNTKNLISRQTNLSGEDLDDEIRRRSEAGSFQLMSSASLAPTVESE
jgi:hypothetical protein